MSSTEIKHGIIVDNKDIYETGKVRVFIIEQDLPTGYRNKSITELKTLLANMDAAGNYIPWQKSTTSKIADPYLAEPFLPKHVNLIPEEGQMVKVILYKEAMYREYVGPVISAVDNLKENYANAQSAHRSTGKKNLIKSGYAPKVEDVALLGDNSQLVLSNKELFLRTNAQDVTTKSKNTELSLLQQSTFNKSLTSTNTVKKVIEEPDRLISHLLEISVVKNLRTVLNEKTIGATFTLKSMLGYKDNAGKLGLTSKNYNTTVKYDGETEIHFFLLCDDINDVIRYTEELKNALLDKQIPVLSQSVPRLGGFLTTIETPTTQLNILDYRSMTRGGAVITDRKEVDVISFVIRFDPDSTITYNPTQETLESLGVSNHFITTNPKFYAKEMNNLIGINNLVDKYVGNRTVESRLSNDGPRVVESNDVTLTYEDKKDSYSVQAAKKIMLLSTQTTPNLISNNPNQYGLTQKELSDLIDIKKQQTYASVRGEKLITLVNRLIDLFLEHGHTTGNTVKNSLEDGTRDELTKLKEELTKKVNPDLSGGPDLLNQYIRLN